MTIKELNQKGFNAAIRELEEEHDNITTYETLKEFAKTKIDNDSLFVAEHILKALNTTPCAEYYEYDFCMGTLQTPRPLINESDLEVFCDDYMLTPQKHNYKGVTMTIYYKRNHEGGIVFTYDHNGYFLTEVYYYNSLRRALQAFRKRHNLRYKHIEVIKSY